ncbi:hypothetical protein KUD11_06955 [Roseovarius sp. LXJ103]|uniref:hypothetical protein n=1 Tax=Roseovarius carneus TaxID=2853164 RepID=UPI000D61986B|nr:hypothetical protein [Roseovarius carneus]MBZ8118385.1 hypothetical protein [Roseovarius carneus]PWE35907.1 hypothetical protein DD563_08010 [Pelagicola sp. LXJ1103]
MDLLIALIAGGVGGVLAGRRRARFALWAKTLLGMLGGGLAVQVLPLLGRAAEGPGTVLWAIGIGAAGGAGLLLVAGFARGMGSK